MALGFCLLGHSVFGSLARWAESERRHHLWRHEEWLQLFIADNYVGKGRSRILLTGPSEAREGLLEEEFRVSLPGAEPYQNAISMGTMEDVLLLLEYIDGAYGRDAMPRQVVLGVTPRFLYNFPPPERRPLPMAIDRYSPFFRIDEEEGRPRLAPVAPFGSFVSQLRFLFKQGRRYRSALKAGALELLREVSLVRGRGRLERDLRPYKYHHLPPLPKEDYRAHFTKHRFDYTLEQKRDELITDAERLLTLCRRRGVELFVVALPRGPWLDDHYEPGFYDAYLQLLREVYGRAVFLDLTRLLGQREFYDHTHCTREGARRITGIVVEAIRRHEERTR